MAGSSDTHARIKWNRTLRTGPDDRERFRTMPDHLFQRRTFDIPRAGEKITADCRGQAGNRATDTGLWFGTRRQPLWLRPKAGFRRERSTFRQGRVGFSYESRNSTGRGRGLRAFRALSAVYSLHGGGREGYSAGGSAKPRP